MTRVPHLEASVPESTSIEALVLSRCRSARQVTLPDKALFYSQGGPATALFLILDGFVKTSRICEEGAEITMALLRRGEIAGEFPNPILPPTHEETARAVGGAVAQRVPAHELWAAMKHDSQLTLVIAEHLARSKQLLERRMLRTMTQSVDRRVIETLVELARSFGARCPHGFSLEIRLTQQDIADLVGASRQVVSSILSDLRKRGLLDYTRDMICVNDGALSLCAQEANSSAIPLSSC